MMSYTPTRKKCEKCGKPILISSDYAYREICSGCKKLSKNCECESL